MCDSFLELDTRSVSHYSKKCSWEKPQQKEEDMTTKINNDTVHKILHDPVYERDVRNAIRAFNDDIAQFMTQLEDCIVLKGMQYYTTNPQETQDNPVLRRSRTVDVSSVSQAYLTNIRFHIGKGDYPVLHMPTVTWAGSGGYWYTATVNQEFFEANEFDYTIPDEIVALSKLYV